MVKKAHIRISLVAQWLRLCASNIGVVGSVPGWGTKIPHAVGHIKKKKATLGESFLNSETQEGVSNTENSREHSGIGSGWYKNPDVWTSLAC